MVLYLRPVIGLLMEPLESKLIQYLQLDLVQVSLLYVLSDVVMGWTSDMGFLTSALDSN